MDAQGRIRASDAEREAIVARLNTATTEGRLSLAEFSERTQLAYAALTREDLARLVADLPVVYAPPVMAPPVMPVPPRSTNNRQVLAMVLGLLSLPVAACIPFGVPLGIAAVVLGVLGLRDARSTPGQGSGRGMALTGIICGIIGAVSEVALVAILLIAGD
jgi:hypothetical protein